MAAGKRDRKLMRSDEAMVMLLDKLVTEVSEIKKQGAETAFLVKQQIPKGMIESLHTKTATTTPQYITLQHSFFSIVLINDGPNDCWVIINTEKSNTTPFLLKVNEVQEADMKTAQIEDIGLHTEEGTAEIRIRGVR